MPKKIAIIEDEETLVKALEAELQHSGYETISAPDGKSGISLIEKEQPNLILLDILMPKLDGFAVLEKIKKEHTTKKIPVIMLSNLGHENDIKKAMEMGAEDYFVKSSTNLQDLPKKIKKYLS
ncbi:MAG: response regulator [Candidatus Magasanikbacteria bacterium]